MLLFGLLLPAIICQVHFLSQWQICLDHATAELNIRLKQSHEPIQTDFEDIPDDLVVLLRDNAFRESRILPEDHAALSSAAQRTRSPERNLRNPAGRFAADT